MSEAKHTPAIAKYKLQIKSNTGYSSTTIGECTPEQYSAALAAIDGECSSQLVRAAPDLLDALIKYMDAIDMFDKASKDGINYHGAVGNRLATEEIASAAIAKATGKTQ